MSEITNTKTWTKIYRTVSSGSNKSKTFLRTLKDDLITAGFSHVKSCDSINISSSSDLWSSDSSLVWSASSAHSWIVLSHSGIVSGMQICIDLNYNYSSYTQVSVFASMSSGFLGGTITSRPMSSDEFSISESTSGNWGDAGDSYVKQYNMFFCPDSIRVYLGHSNNAHYGFWHFDKINNAPIWLTKPIVLKVGTSTPTPLVRSAFVQSSGFSYCYINSIKTPIKLGGIYLGSTAVQDSSTLNSGDLNGDWPTSEVLVISDSTVCPGIFGYLSDMWHVVDDLVDFDYFPGDGSKAQVVLQDIAQGSDGSDVSW